MTVLQQCWELGSAIGSIVTCGNFCEYVRIAYSALFERCPTLRLAAPPAQVPIRSDMAVYGVHSLPVSW